MSKEGEHCSPQSTWGLSSAGKQAAKSSTPFRERSHKVIHKHHSWKCIYSHTNDTREINQLKHEKKRKERISTCFEICTHMENIARLTNTIFGL